jgi:hypothetical protein
MELLYSADHRQVAGPYPFVVRDRVANLVFVLVSCSLRRGYSFWLCVANARKYITKTWSKTGLRPVDCRNLSAAFGHRRLRDRGGGAARRPRRDRRWLPGLCASGCVRRYVVPYRGRGAPPDRGSGRRDDLRGIARDRHGAGFCAGARSKHPRRTASVEVSVDFLFGVLLVRRGANASRFGNEKPLD